MDRIARGRWAPWLVFALALLGQALLVFNPGYFSHDELQWAARAGNSGPLPWVPWTSWEAFQYRPLTFNLWLALSRALFAQPWAFHLLLVAWGAGNAALLCALARRLGVAPWPALLGALVFALGPYAAYTHGWIGTLGDVAWLGCALLLGVFVARRPGALAVVVAAALLTLLGLLAKEAAVSIPALLLLAWWLGGRARHWGVATLASGAVVALYLALRIAVLLHAPRVGGQYALAMDHVPLRWLEYQLYAPLPSVFETFNTLSAGAGKRLALAGLLWLGLLATLVRVRPRLAALYLLGGVAALAPVLPLASSYNQYGYGFAALATMTVAAAWPSAARPGRVLIGLVALLCVWHGVNVMRTMRHVGQVQAVFSPALAQAVQARGGQPVTLRPAADAEPWIFVRLSHEIPAYRGVALGDRVRLVAPGAAADFEIAADGHLHPLR